MDSYICVRIALQSSYTVAMAIASYQLYVAIASYRRFIDALSLHSAQVANACNKEINNQKLLHLIHSLMQHLLVWKLNTLDFPH